MEYRQFLKNSDWFVSDLSDVSVHRAQAVQKKLYTATKHSFL